MTVPDWLWPPLHGAGYQFWSGIGSDVGEAGILASIGSVAFVSYRRLECHADGCHRLAWHVHDGHGHPVCRKHHPEGEGRPHTIGGTTRRRGAIR